MRKTNASAPASHTAVSPAALVRPYAPEGKGKLERWHRTLRDQFLGELDERHIAGLDDLNARLWAWLEQVYHRTEHAGLARDELEKHEEAR